MCQCIDPQRTKCLGLHPRAFLLPTRTYPILHFLSCTSVDEVPKERYTLYSTSAHCPHTIAAPHPADDATSTSASGLICHSWHSLLIFHFFNPQPPSHRMEPVTYPRPRPPKNNQVPKKKVNPTDRRHLIFLLASPADLLLNLPGIINQSRRSVLGSTPTPVTSHLYTAEFLALNPTA